MSRRFGITDFDTPRQIGREDDLARRYRGAHQQRTLRKEPVECRCPSGRQPARADIVSDGLKFRRYFAP
jgi:hypothetical protein